MFSPSSTLASVPAIDTDCRGCVSDRHPWIYFSVLVVLVGISTTTQKRGLALYLAGVILYYLFYGTQNFFPNSDWSTSTIGFAALENLSW